MCWTASEALNPHNVSGPLGGKKDDLGHTPKILCQYFERPLQKKLMLVNSTGSSVMPAAPIVPNATMLCPKRSGLEQLHANASAQKIRKKINSQQQAERGKTNNQAGKLKQGQHDHILQEQQWKIWLGILKVCWLVVYWTSKEAFEKTLVVPNLLSLGENHFCSSLIFLLLVKPMIALLYTL